MVCGRPPEGRRTIPVPELVNLTFGDVYIYSCNPDFFLPPPPEMKLKTMCLANGSFSLTPLPECIGE